MELKREDKYNLHNLSFHKIRDLASSMRLPRRRSKDEYIGDIENVFDICKEHTKGEKYTKIKQLGKRGKDGTVYLVKNKNGKKFAMKVFRKNKNSKSLIREYDMQKEASKIGVAPKVVECNVKEKYIVMERMDRLLIDSMKKRNGLLTRTRQMEILNIFRKLDKARIFHGDPNLLNFMIKNGRIYLIDYGFSKPITEEFMRKEKTQTPNMTIMSLGFILKLRDLKCPPESWTCFKKKISNKIANKYDL